MFFRMRRIVTILFFICASHCLRGPSEGINFRGIFGLPIGSILENDPNDTANSDHPSVGSDFFSISGSVGGLAPGAAVVLRDNGRDDLSIYSDGSYTFPTRITNGGAYDVTVYSNPSTPSQFCSVLNGSGIVSGTDVTGITVSCGNRYALGGTVTGLSGNVTLLNSVNGDTSVVSSNGGFTMSVGLQDGDFFRIQVVGQPNSQSCKTSLNYGTISSASVTNVRVHCQTDTPPYSNLIEPVGNIRNTLTLSGDMEVAASGVLVAGTKSASGSSAFHLSFPLQIASDGNTIYVADYGNDMVRKIDVPRSFVLENSTDLFSSPAVSAVATDGVFVYAAGENSAFISRYDLGTGSLSQLSLDAVHDIAGIATDGVRIYFSGRDHTLRVLDQNTGNVTVLLGTSGIPGAVANQISPSYSVADYGSRSLDDPAFPAFLLADPAGIHLYENLDPSGGVTRSEIFIANKASNNIIKFDIKNRRIRIVTGGLNGQDSGFYDWQPASNARFSAPTSVFYDAPGDKLYVADNGSGLIRYVDFAQDKTVRLVGKGGAGQYSGHGSNGTTPKANVYPYGMTSDGRNIFVSEYINHVIRKVE